tara:strand:+ start:865 stop:1110 length:246 start_codon:yes stop_codon:yes gene_type:complete
MAVRGVDDSLRYFGRERHDGRLGRVVAQDFVPVLDVEGALLPPPVETVVFVVVVLVVVVIDVVFRGHISLRGGCWLMSVGT